MYARARSVSRRISIHAPREGERQNARAELLQHIIISIHAPREGERLADGRLTGTGGEFQSTLPARGSDGKSRLCQARHAHFNPRSPRGGAT